jgi:hypothetical protein
MIGNEDIGNGYYVGNGRDRSLPNYRSICEHPDCNVDQSQYETDCSQLDEQPNQMKKQKIKPIPELFGAFKTTSSKLIHQSGFTNFHWQKSFHDTIVRDEQSLL